MINSDLDLNDPRYLFLAGKKFDPAKQPFLPIKNMNQRH